MLNTKQSLEQNLSSETLKTFSDSIKVSIALFFLISILITITNFLIPETKTGIDLQSHVHAAPKTVGNVFSSTADSRSNSSIEPFNCSAKWKEQLSLFIPVNLRENDLRALEWEHIFMRSFLFNWPVQTSNTSITIVLNAESNPYLVDTYIRQPMEKRKELGPRYPTVDVRYHIHEPGVYPSGYDRQQYLAFIADNFTSAEFVGFTDTDTFIHSYVTELDIFDEKGRPIVNGRIGYLEKCRLSRCNLTPYREMWAEATLNITGLQEAVNCMSYFPIVVKGIHLKELREFLRLRWAKSTFQEAYSAFVNAQKIWGPRRRHMYCQFNIICTYLWWHKRDEYSWAIHDASPQWDGVNPPPSPGQLGNKSIFSPSYLQIKPYIANHMISDWKEYQVIQDIMVSYMTTELCFRLPHSNFFKLANLTYYHLPDGRKLSVTERVLSAIARSNFSAQCNTSYFPENYDRDMFKFEETDYNKIYSTDLLRATFTARNDKISVCNHTYIFI